MKKIKLLAPLLGLSTVATVVAPVATSCTSETISTNHTSRPECYTKKLIKHDNGIKYAEYLVNLDSDEYDKNGFSVGLSFTEGYETYNYDINDFDERHELDGNQLHIYVIYNGSLEVKDDSTLTLNFNLNIKYGTQWQETVNVKLEVEIFPASYELLYNATDYNFQYSGFTMYAGQTVDLYVDLTVAKTKTEFWDQNYKFVFISNVTAGTYIGFKSAKLYVDGVELVEEEDWYWRSDISSIVMNVPGLNKMLNGSVFKARLINVDYTCTNCKAVVGYGRA